MEFIHLPVQAKNKPPTARWGWGWARPRWPVLSSQPGVPAYAHPPPATGPDWHWSEVPVRGNPGRCQTLGAAKCSLPRGHQPCLRGQPGSARRVELPRGDPGSCHAGIGLMRGERETEAGNGFGKEQTRWHERDGKMSLCPCVFLSLQLLLHCQCLGQPWYRGPIPGTLQG